MTPSAADIMERVDAGRLARRLTAMVKTPSENPPGREQQMGDLVRSYLDEVDISSEVYEAQPGRPNVVARWSAGDGPTLTYCTHLDTVPVGDPSLWDGEPLGAHIDDGKLHGRGSADAKGAIAAILEAMTVMKELGVTISGTLELALVSDEETMGFMGAGYLVKQGLIHPDIAVVGEPTSLRIVKAQRGACWTRVITHGVAGHGSAPERGVNAIKHMAEIVSHLEEALPDISHPVLGRPTLNVGTISGGEKINVIPARCVIEIDRRTIPGETRESVTASIEDAVERARKRFSDINADVEVIFFANPFEVNEASPVVRAMRDAVDQVIGAPAELTGFRGASDARFLAEAGADVIVFGPGDIAVAHTAREFVDMQEVEHAAAAYALAFSTLLAPGA